MFFKPIPIANHLTSAFRSLVHNHLPWWGLGKCNEILFCSPTYPRTQDLPASVSQVLGLQAGTIIARQGHLVYKPFLAPTERSSSSEPLWPPRTHCFLLFATGAFCYHGWSSYQIMNSSQTRTSSCASVSLRSLTHDRWTHGSTTYLRKEPQINIMLLFGGKGLPQSPSPLVLSALWGML